MKTLPQLRQSIRHLLDERHPRDAMAAYFALHHPEAKTQLVTYPADAALPTGYVAVSRTGMDLFRPLLTFRLPPQDMEGSVELIYRTLLPGTAVFMDAPTADVPLIRALFEIQVEEDLQLFVLDPSRFEPVINVLVTQTDAANGLPRFAVRSEAEQGAVVASAHLNWQSPYFAEIAVNTLPRYQRQGWGRSVVAAMVQYLLANGRTPLYVAAAANAASINLAERVGFTDTGVRTWMLQGTLRPKF
ncbi:MAG: GNAT family N-acetyltransferase [Anaerolinea sp.]|nr:GNAT family N-acetyltransferase [Anaerolinea sp.]